MVKGKKKSSKRKSRKYGKRRWKDTKMPFETVVVGVTIPFTPAADGFGSIFECIQSGDIQGIIDNLKCGFLGYEPTRGTTQINFAAALNPFDLNHARFTKEIMYSVILYKFRKAITGNSMTNLVRKIPWIGRRIK